MSLSAPCAAARSCRLATRSTITPSTHCLRLTSSPSLHRRQKPSRRWQSTDAAATNPKISGIVDQISQLTLLETADLVASLKVQIPHINPSASTSLIPSSLTISSPHSPASTSPTSLSPRRPLPPLLRPPPQQPPPPKKTTPLLPPLKSPSSHSNSSPSKQPRNPRSSRK
jgi:hypothetical protein